MLESKGSFIAEIKLPKGTRLDYYFKITKDNAGKKIKGYDRNGGNTYFSVAEHDETIIVNGSTLKINKEPFSVARLGKYLLLAAVLFLFITLAFFRKNKKVQLPGLVPAYWLAATAMILLARANIAGTGLDRPQSSLLRLYKMLFK